MATRKLITSRVAAMYVPSKPSLRCYPAPKRAAQRSRPIPRLCRLCATAAASAVKAAAFDAMAQSVIVATGAWVSELSPSVAAPIIRICRQTLHWFPVTDLSLYRLGFSPTFYWTHGASSADQFYGFPPIDGHIKVAAEQYTETCDPNDLSRDVSPLRATADERTSYCRKIGGCGRSANAVEGLSLQRDARLRLCCR